MKKIYYVLLLLCSINLLQAQDNKLKVGQIAPEIAVANTDGDTVSLSSLRGRLVLIDFWATWCAPCVEEQPELKAIYEKHKATVEAEKFEILGVSLDKNKDNWTKAIERLEIPWIQVSDLKFWKSPVAKDYKIEALPFNVLVDETGQIVAINLHGAELENFIDGRLNSDKVL